MSNETLSKYFDAVIKNDEENLSESFNQYIEAKGKSVFRELLAEAEKPVRLKGNDVLVKGKKVGSIEHDADKDEGIKYTCDTSGKTSTHESLPKLFSHLSKEHKLEEGEKVCALYCGKKGEGTLKLVKKGTRAELEALKNSEAHKDKDHVHKIEEVEGEPAETIKESLAEEGNKELAGKSEKDFKGFKNDDDLKLTKTGETESKTPGGNDNTDKQSDVEKRKNEAKKQAEKAQKAYRKIDWKA